MKELQVVGLTRLTNVEFGQHIKSVYQGINKLNSGNGFIKDAGIIKYLTNLENQSNDYDKALLQIFKSDETTKIVTADHTRDIALTALRRYLSVFELSDVEAEVLAYDSLKTIFSKYKNLKDWNFEEESNGIDNLIADLNEPKYKESVTIIGMTLYVTRLAKANDTFKEIFAKRTLETASKEVHDAKKTRAAMLEMYNNMADYILAMAKLNNTEEFNQSLNVLNTVRKYYADLLAKRKATSKDDSTPPPPIPPMS